MSAPGVLAVMDPQAELGVKQSAKNPNAGFVDWRDWCAYLGRANEARAAVAELLAACRERDEAEGEHDSAVEWYGPNSNAKAMCAARRRSIAARNRYVAAIAACGEQP